MSTATKAWCNSWLPIGRCSAERQRACRRDSRIANALCMGARFAGRLGSRPRSLSGAARPADGGFARRRERSRNLAACQRGTRCRQRLFSAEHRHLDDAELLASDAARACRNGRGRGTSARHCRWAIGRLRDENCPSQPRNSRLGRFGSPNPGPGTAFVEPKVSRNLGSRSAISISRVPPALRAISRRSRASRDRHGLLLSHVVRAALGRARFNRIAAARRRRRRSR